MPGSHIGIFFMNRCGFIYIHANCTPCSQRQGCSGEKKVAIARHSHSPFNFRFVGVLAFVPRPFVLVALGQLLGGSGCLWLHLGFHALSSGSVNYYVSSVGLYFCSVHLKNTPTNCMQSGPNSRIAGFLFLTYAWLAGHCICCWVAGLAMQQKKV